LHLRTHVREFDLQQLPHRLTGIHLACAKVNQFLDFRQRKAQSLHLLDEAKPFRIVIGEQPESTRAANWFGQKSAFFIEADCINRQSSSLCEFAEFA